MSVQTQIDRISGAVQSALAALTEKGVTVPDGTKVDGLAALIAAIEAGGGGLEVKSFTVATNTQNFVVEKLDAVPRAVAWWDADFSNSEDTVIDQYKPILANMLRIYGGNSMRAVSAYKSSSSKATSYSSAVQSNRTTATFSAGDSTFFSTDAFRVMKNGADKLCLAAFVLGNYGFRAGQTINYVVIW